MARVPGRLREYQPGSGAAAEFAQRMLGIGDEYQ
jgi:hypothetical protein